jgi:hypothetical protein
VTKHIVPADYTPALEESRRLTTKSGDLVSAQLVSKLTKLAQDASDLESVLPRVIITAESLERGADFKKAASAAYSSAEEARKSITEPARDFTTLVNTLFKKNVERIGVVVIEVTKRLDAYYADIEAKRVIAETAAAANKPVSAEVTAAVLAPTKVTSNYGTTASSSRKVRGELTNLRAFLSWASESATDEELGAITVGKKLVNTLAIDADAQVVAEELTAIEFEANTGVKIIVEQKANVR